MQLRDGKLTEISMLVRLQNGQELTGRLRILYPCKGQVRMKRALFWWESDRDERRGQTFIEVC